jgi:hypothetical protein
MGDNEIREPDWYPIELARRPFILQRGRLEIRSSVSVDLSQNLLGEPVRLAPALAYGVTNSLTVGVETGGLCVTGSNHGCANVFNDVAVNAILAVLAASAGNLLVGLRADLALTTFDPAVAAGARIAAIAKVTNGTLAVQIEPSLQLGIGQRDAYNWDSLALSVELQWQIVRRLAAFFRTGIGTFLNGPLRGDAAVPVGIGVLGSVSRAVDAGLRFTFPHLLGTGATADLRSVEVLVNIRL